MTDNNKPAKKVWSKPEFNILDRDNVNGGGTKTSLKEGVAIGGGYYRILTDNGGIAFNTNKMNWLNYHS